MAWGDKGNQGGPWGNGPWGGSGGSGGGNGGGGQGGRGNGGGGQKPPKPPTPPDFDEMIRRSQERFKQMFPGDKPNNPKSYGLLAAGVVAMWLVFGGSYYVNTDEIGIVTRFGAFHRTSEPGLRWHWPAPIEEVEKPRVTAVNTTEIGLRSSANQPARKGKNTSPDASVPLSEESLMLTGDENIIEANFVVQWKIRADKAADFLFNVRNPEETVKAVAESAMREVIGRTDIMTVISDEAGKAKVGEDTRALLQKTLDTYNAGIYIDRVNLLDANPPSQVLDAFRDVQTAKADRDTARNQAEAYRNDILPRARGEAERIVQEAEAYKQEVVARARGEASRFAAVYQEYAAAKDVTKKRMYLETMEQILNGMNKVIVDGKGNNMVPYLPLSELKPAAKGDAKAEEAKP